MLAGIATNARILRTGLSSLIRAFVANSSEINILSFLNLKNSRCGFTLSFIALICAQSVFAQDKTISPEQREAEERVKRWRSRVDDLVKISATSSSSLTEAENAYNQALLAKILWKHDEVSARAFLKKSAEIVLKSLKGEDEKELEKNLEYAQRTLEIIFELDRKFGSDLLGKLGSNFDDKINQNARQNPKLAKFYASIGAQITKENPRLGLAYGQQSLKFGFAHALSGLAVELNLKDSSLADLLIKQTRFLATDKYREDVYFLVFGLYRGVFEFNKGKPFSATTQRLVVELFSDLLNGAASIEQERPRRCGISFYASWAVSRVDEFFPENSERFRQNIKLCVPFLHTSIQTGTKARADGVSDSVDEMLKAARDEKDKRAKIHIYRDAFFKLLNAKSYDELTSLLDGLDGDDYREIAPIGWNNWRITAGFSTSLASFEEGDLANAFKSINRAPKQLRPFIRKRLASETSVSKDKQFYFENLSEMQKELNSLEMPYHEAAALSLDLAKFYLRATPTESPVVFRDAVKFINKADGENPDMIIDKDWAPMSDYVSVDATILEIDEFSIFASINDISSRRSRLKLSLGLLESSLKALSKANDELEKQKSLAAKKK